MPGLEDGFKKDSIQQLQAEGLPIFRILNIIASIEEHTENGKPPTRDHTSLSRYEEISFEQHFFRLVLESEIDEPEERELFIKKIADGKLTEEELARVKEICDNYLLSMLIQTIARSKIFQQGGKIVMSMDRG